MFNLKLGRDFVVDVERMIAPGRSALVAQVFEEETAPVDERMAAFGGVVFRRPIGDLADDDYQHAVARVRRQFT